MTKNDVYSEVTDRIIAALEAGVVPWRRPWDKGASAGPISLRGGKPYRGINVFMLELEAMTCGYADPRWGTYKAITEAGGQVRKGEKGTRVILWKPVKKEKTEAEAGSGYLLLRSYTVFNVEQADGIEPLSVTEADYVDPDEKADAIIEGYAAPVGPAVIVRGNQAAYSPERDMVYMPAREAFHGTGEYYTTILHELAHSTGHEKRLGRIEPALFGSDPYAKEELVAEMTAAMLSRLAGIETTQENSAAYIGHWLGRLKDDRKLVVQAAAQAQKAADLILGETHDKTETPPLAAAA